MTSTTTAKEEKKNDVDAERFESFVGRVRRGESDE
jgi:hypothetical protein